jgi:outer membrane lipase/esterase
MTNGPVPRNLTRLIFKLTCLPVLGSRTAGFERQADKRGKKIMRSKWLICAFLGAALTCPAHALEPKYESVVVFGDSLVDAGNVHVLSDGRRPEANKGYVAGRFTNGYVFSDYIAMGIEGRVTAPSRAGGNNFAYGGARVLTNADPIPDSTAQIAEYRSTLKGRPDARTLFMLTFGSNDLGASTQEVGKNFPDISTYLQAVAEGYASAAQSLFEIGAQTVLITYPPVGGGGAPLAEELKQKLDRALASLRLTEGQTLLRYDLRPFWDNVVGNPSAAGLGEAKLSPNCIDAGAQATGCAGYLLFDYAHPVAELHTLAAKDIAEQLDIPVRPPPIN